MKKEEEKKTERMHVALSRSERREIEDRAYAFDLTVSELLRLGALQYKVAKGAKVRGIQEVKPSITGSTAHAMRLTPDFKLDYDTCTYFLYKDLNLICTSPIGQTAGALYPTFDLSDDPISVIDNLNPEWTIYRRAIFPYMKKGMILNRFQLQSLSRLGTVLENPNHQDSKLGSCAIYKLKRENVQLIYLVFDDDVKGCKGGYIHQIAFT